MAVYGGPIEKPENLSPGLLRQRRNLIIIATFLILFDVATVKPEKLAIFGAELGLPKGGTYVTIAWLFLGYFLWRYYQYLNTEADLGLKTRRIFEFAEGKMGEWFERTFAEEHTESRGSHHVVRHSFLHWDFVFSVYDTATSKAHEEPRRIPIHVALRALLSAFLHTTFRTPYVTDFLLPIALAIAAPFMYLFQHT